MHRQLWELTIRGIQRKKKTSILMFLILLISFSFAIFALSVTESIRASNTAYRLDTYGAWEYAVYGGAKEDAARYRELQETAETGTAVCYGTVTADGVYGTLDPELREMGHLRLQKGHFPEQPDEIAIEADILNELGCGYTLGQTIRLQIDLTAATAARSAVPETQEPGSAVIMEQTYRLCGVISEYTDLWENGQGRLPGAVVTEEAALELYAGAVEKYKTTVLNRPVYQYFFRAKENLRELRQALEDNGITAANGREDNGGRQLVFNAASVDTSDEIGSYYFYLVMIFCVTLLAVCYVYLSQMEQEVRRLALFRSIGITRKQLQMQLMDETLCFVVPAVLIGTLLSCVVIRVLLHSLLTIHTRKIQITIPVLPILGLMLLWLAGVFLVRLLLFYRALRQPLRGQIRTGHQKAQRYRIIRRGLLFVLSAAACATLIFSCMQAGKPRIMQKCMEARYAYRFMSTENRAKVSGKQFAEDLAALSGIREVKTWTAFSGDLYLDPSLQMESKIESAQEMGNSFHSGNRKSIDLYGFSPADWEKITARAGTADTEALRKGEAVILVVSREKAASDLLAFKPGDRLTLDFYTDPASGATASCFLSGRNNTQKTTCGLQVGAVLQNADELYLDASDFFFHLPYGILCPTSLLEKILQAAVQAENPSLENLRFGDLQGEIYVDAAANDPATDYLVSNLCKQYGYWFIANRREENMVRIQQSVQALVQLFASGGVILCVSLLLLRNSLLLSGEGETRRIAILRTLGLSGNRLRLKILREAAVTALLAAAAAWGCFGCYLLYVALEKKSQLLNYFGEIYSFREILVRTLLEYQNYGIGLREILLLSAIGMLLIGSTVFCAKRRMLHVRLLQNS